MSDTPLNDALMERMAGAPDAEHLVALDNLCRQLERERAELIEALRELLEDTQHRNHNCGDIASNCCVMRAYVMRAYVLLARLEGSE